MHRGDLPAGRPARAETGAGRMTQDRLRRTATAVLRALPVPRPGGSPRNPVTIMPASQTAFLLAPTRTDRIDLATLVWAPDAPAALASAARSGDGDRFVRQLVRRGVLHAQESRRARSETLLAAAELIPPAESSRIGHLTREALLAFAEGVRSREAANLLAALLEAADDQPLLSLRDLAAGLSLLAPAARRVDGEPLLALWGRLLRDLRTTLQPETPADFADAPAERFLRDEVRLRGGLLFPHLAEAQAWRTEGADAWQAAISHICDDVGMPAAPVASVRWAVGSLVRVCSDAAAAGVELFNVEQAEQLRRFAGRLAAFALPSGALVLDRADAPPLLDALHALLRSTGWKRRTLPRRLVDNLREGRSLRAWRRREVDAPSHGRSIPAASQSDSTRIALLRSNWSPTASLCGLDHSGSEVRIDAALDGERVLAGPWELELTINGQPVTLASPWKCDCWFSDRDADFIELACDLGNGLAVTRQVLLARREPLLVLMEAVRGAPDDFDVSLRSILPLADGRAVEADGYTRELQFLGEAGRLRMFPASLPPHRPTAADGEFVNDGRELTWSRQARGSLAQVLFIDGSDRGGRQPADWGPVTVAEDGRRLTPREAVATRLRVGERQWLYWHNLTAGRIPRSALGHHSHSETVIARFTPEKGVDPLVHVDADTASPQPVV